MERKWLGVVLNWMGKAGWTLGFGIFLVKFGGWWLVVGGGCKPTGFYRYSQTRRNKREKRKGDGYGGGKMELIEMG